MKRRLGVLGVLLLAVVATSALFTTASPAGAQQSRYTDDDSAYLKVIDTFAYPVGVLLEWTVFRPLHALESRGVQGVSEGRVESAGTARVRRGCQSSRPPRYCAAP